MKPSQKNIKETQKEFNSGIKERCPNTKEVSVNSKVIVCQCVWSLGHNGKCHFENPGFKYQRDK